MQVGPFRRHQATSRAGVIRRFSVDGA